jgi:hypothetical protein
MPVAGRGIGRCSSGHGSRSRCGWRSCWPSGWGCGGQVCIAHIFVGEAVGVVGAGEHQITLRVTFRLSIAMSPRFPPPRVAVTRGSSCPVLSKWSQPASCHLDLPPLSTHRYPSCIIAISSILGANRECANAAAVHVCGSRQRGLAPVLHPKMFRLSIAKCRRGFAWSARSTDLVVAV